MWARLRNRQIGGRKFRRQQSVSVYIVDFYCADCRLAVELDGDSHDGAKAQAYDAARSEYLTGLGIQVVRFTNQDVSQRVEFVVEAILFLLGEETSP